MNFIEIIVSMYDIKNFQNLELGRGFSRIEKPITVSITKSERRFPFMIKLNTIVRITI